MSRIDNRYASIGQQYNARSLYLSAPMYRARALADDVSVLCRSYIPISSWAEAANCLSPGRSQRVVALVGEKESGRRITAVNLAVRSGLVPQDFLPDLVVESGKPVLKEHSLLMKEGEAYLLDLDSVAGVPTEQLERFVKVQLADLPGGAALIILTQPGLWKTLRLPVQAIKVIATERTLAVYHLLMAATPQAQRVAWWQDQRLLDSVGADTPAGAFRTAMEVRARLGLDRDEKELVQEILDARSDWTAEVERFFSDTANDDRPDKRALLLASIACDGCTMEEIFEAQGSLIEMVQEDPPRAFGLMGKGRAQQLRDVKAEADEGGRYRLKSGYGWTAACHAWSEQGFQAKFKDWLVALPTKDRPGPGHLYLELARRFGDRQMIVDAVEQWARNSELLPLAVDVLDLAAVDARLGQMIRDLLYQWAGQSKGNRPELVARVCSGGLGRMHTGIALTRLRRLANTCQDTDRRHVCEALVRLAEDPGTRRQVIEEIMRWHEAGSILAGSVLDAIAAKDLIVPDGELTTPDIELVVRTLSVLLQRPHGMDMVTLWLRRLSAGTASAKVFLAVVEELLAGEGKMLVSAIVLTAQDFIEQTPEASDDLIAVIGRAKEMFKHRAPVVARSIADYLDRGEAC
ncbi:hypothetical protein [Actinocorallia libanotica]|uniref:HEAT repeat protein n=1 Tax=Actinocorallia libanotica TaxID=46162 RepID=A0ABN1S300_9ACTN